MQNNEVTQLQEELKTVKADAYDYQSELKKQLKQVSLHVNALEQLIAHVCESLEVDYKEARINEIAERVSEKISELKPSED